MPERMETGHQPVLLGILNDLRFLLSAQVHKLSESSRHKELNLLGFLVLHTHTHTNFLTLLKCIYKEISQKESMYIFR